MEEVSDLRLTAACSGRWDDCNWSVSGTSALDWTAAHIDVYPDHLVTITRSGDMERKAGR